MVLLKLILRGWVNYKTNTAFLTQSLPDSNANSNSGGKAVVDIIFVIIIMYLT